MVQHLFVGSDLLSLCSGLLCKGMQLVLPRLFSGASIILNCGDIVHDISTIASVVFSNSDNLQTLGQKHNQNSQNLVVCGSFVKTDNSVFEVEASTT